MGQPQMRGCSCRGGSPTFGGRVAAIVGPTLQLLLNSLHRAACASSFATSGVAGPGVHRRPPSTTGPPSSPNRCLGRGGPSPRPGGRKRNLP
eukprot:366338-Chlamydomonas_euryale.AAC.7